MEFCLSCCRSRSRTEEREPLLWNSGTAPLLPPQSELNKVPHVLAALRAGKLPSQDQINSVLRRLLRSDVLAIYGSKSARVLGQGKEYGPLSECGKTVLRDVRVVLEAVVQFGMEKNDDDRIQNLIHEITSMARTPLTVNFDVTTSCETSDEMGNLASTSSSSSEELKNDAHHLSRSLLTLSRLLLTSSTFRLLLSDVLLMATEFLADVAADVGGIARAIEIKAKTVQEALRPDDEQEDKLEYSRASGIQARAQSGDVADGAKAERETLGQQSPEPIKEVVLEKLQKAIGQARQAPAYKSALNTLLFLLRKHVERESTAMSAVSLEPSSSATVTPKVTADPNFAFALTDLRIILERLALGYSLSPLIASVEDILRDLISPSSTTFKTELRQYCDDFGQWLDKSLHDSSFATSLQGRLTVERLYDRGREMMRSEENAEWAQDSRKCLDTVGAFANALVADKTTQRVTGALEKLSDHFAEFSKVAVGTSHFAQRKRREEMKRDVLGWIIPRALGMLNAIPMPHVEVKSSTLELAIDATLLCATSASFVPDHAVVQNWNEVRLEASTGMLHPDAPSEDDMLGKMTTSTRTHIHIDGLRISAHQVGYHVKYMGPFGGLISWEDNGFLDIDVGRYNTAGEGLALDIEVETFPVDDNDASTFLVKDVKVDVPGLRLVVNNSRHWIYNKFILQPIAGPFVQRMLRTILVSQVIAGLEGLNARILDVRTRAKERVTRTQTKGPSWEDYWEALLETLGPPKGGTYEGQEEDGVREPLVETDTHVTRKGVVKGTVMEAVPDPSPLPRPSEIFVEIGVGAQILPRNEESPQGDAPLGERVRDVPQDVEEAADEFVGGAWEVQDEGVVTTVQKMEELGGVSERTETNQFGVQGWRSRAFDF